MAEWKGREKREILDLETLDISYNKLSGVVNLQLGGSTSCKAQISLWISLSGWMLALGKHQGLEELVLIANSFDCQIPSEIGDPKQASRRLSPQLYMVHVSDKLTAALRDLLGKIPKAHLQGRGQIIGRILSTNHHLTRGLRMASRLKKRDKGCPSPVFTCRQRSKTSNCRLSPPLSLT